MAVDGFGQRIRQALLDYASQIGERVPQSRIAAMLAEEEGRGSYSAALITEWINERSTPQLRAIEALARVIGKPAGWLAFGDDAMAVGAPKKPAHYTAPTLPVETLKIETATPKRQARTAGKRRR